MGAGAPSPADLRAAEAASRSFARALLARDPAGAAGHLSPGACILTADGTEVLGRAAVREVLAQITSSGQELEILLGRTVVCGDLALAVQYWRRRSSGFDESTAARLVLAREGGRWAIAIASPWG